MASFPAQSLSRITRLHLASFFRGHLAYNSALNCLELIRFYDVHRLYHGCMYVCMYVPTVIRMPKRPLLFLSLSVGRELGVRLKAQPPPARILSNSDFKYNDHSSVRVNTAFRIHVYHHTRLPRWGLPASFLNLL